MVRLARLLALLVPPAEVLVVVLLLTGVELPMPVIVAAESAVATVIVVEVTTAYRLFREERRAGAGRRAAAAAVWRRLVPEPARRALAFEMKGTASVALWLLRRRDGVPPGATALPYAGEQWPMLLILIGAMAVEGVVVEVLLAAFDVATAIRVVVIVLHVYTIWLLLAAGASCAVRPHVVTGDTLRIRYGSSSTCPCPARSSPRYGSRGGTTSRGWWPSRTAGSPSPSPRGPTWSWSSPSRSRWPVRSGPGPRSPRSASSPPTRPSPSPRSARERRHLTPTSKDC